MSIVITLLVFLVAVTWIVHVMSKHDEDGW